MLERLISFLGIFVLLGIAWLLSNNRRKINYRLVAWGLGLQMSFALIILRTGPGKVVFSAARQAIVRMLSFTDAGAGFLFGNLYRANRDIIENLPQGGPMSGQAQLWDAGGQQFVDLGIVFVIHILPTIIFFASLMGVLYHLGVMQRMVQVFAWVMAKFMGTSGAESLSAAANIFVGQTEAPLVIRPYVKEMTNSEIMAIMTGGFATVAGGVMAAYVRLGIDAGHLLAASVMSAPAALVVAKVMFPEVGEPKTAGSVKMEVEKKTANVIDAAARGAGDGLRLAANVGAMLLAFLALLAMINYPLSYLGTSLEEIFGWFFRWIALAMGVPWADSMAFGELLGTKIAVNEFVGYLKLNGLKETLSPRSYVIATYALCGFSNFGSIAIQIGGIGAIAPSRQQDLARLGLKAMIGGALASWMTASIAGVLL